ncbi:MAG TPA: zonular occludens toxin domain-containing protein [Vicingaceae bacterium]
MSETIEKKHRGRKKISYSKEDLERQPMLVLTCGETGVGKTYRNLIEIFRYMKDDSDTGRKGRKVLAFDVNDDDYPQFKTVKVNLIQNLTAINARRIRPITKSGRNMSIEEKRDVVEQMVNRFKNGLLVLEDLDKYMVGAKGQSIVGLLTTNRHNGLDIMISHQSIAKITTTEWENCTWLRLHHQVDDISRYRERIPNYFLVRIATFIVDEQYDLANAAYVDGDISKDEFKKRKSFCVYVDMRRLRIRGVSRAAFIRAAKKYIDTHESRKVKMMLQEMNMDDSPKFKNRSEVVVHLIAKYLRHHEQKVNSAF